MGTVFDTNILPLSDDGLLVSPPSPPHINTRINFSGKDSSDKYCHYYHGI